MRSKRVAPLIVLSALLTTLFATPLAACSLVPPWEITDPTLIAFRASPLPDTVRADNGPFTPTRQMGHSGNGSPRVAYGQRVRVTQMGEHARRALPAGTTEVLLVPWDYGPDCSPVAWGRSARWLPDSVSGIFRARLRARAKWADGLPTFDIVGTHDQPYRSTTDYRSRSTTSLNDAGLLAFYDVVPPSRDEADTLVIQRWISRVRADSAMADKYPVSAALWLANYRIENARLLGIRVPIVGTFRLRVTIDSSPARTMFLRVARRVSSADYAPAPGGASAGTRLLSGYTISATTAAALKDLRPTCYESYTNAALRGYNAYVYLGLPSSTATDGLGEWTTGIDSRLLRAVLSDDQLKRWQSVLDVTVRATAQGRMLVEGDVTRPGIGRIRVRGERISRVELACS